MRVHRRSLELPNEEFPTRLSIGKLLNDAQVRGPVASREAAPYFVWEIDVDTFFLWGSFFNRFKTLLEPFSRISAESPCASSRESPGDAASDAVDAVLDGLSWA